MKLTKSALIAAATLWLALSIAAARVAWVNGQADALTLTRPGAPCGQDQTLSCLENESRR
jgi:hypothetical protein